MSFDGFFDLCGERSVVGNQHRLRADIVLGLRQQISGDPVGIAGLVGQYQHFGWPGNHVDTDFAKYQTLCSGNVGIAGSDNLGDRRDTFGAVSQRSHSLCTSDAVNLVDARKFGRRQYQRTEFAIGRRHHHCEPRHTGDLGRDGIHENGRWIGGRAARYIKANRLDRCPLCAELDSNGVREALFCWFLTAVVSLDAIAREPERGQCFALTRFLRRLDFGGGYAQAGLGKIDTIELCGQFEQRDIAARSHIGNDAAHDLLDVLRDLALHRKKTAETVGKIRALTIQAKGHALIPPGINARKVNG